MLNELLKNTILSQNPTEEQKAAIFSAEVGFLLRAAPGSGKTWTSCRRFIWRGANWPHRVGGLALLSFTNVAIREFQHETIKVGQRNLLTDPNYVGTFDSFVERYILAPFGHLIAGASKRPRLFISPRPGDWDNKKLKMWVEGPKKRKIPIPAWEIVPVPDDKKLRFRASQHFGDRELGSDAAVPLRELLKLGFYTHSQRVFWACEVLFERPHLASLLARRFPEIIVDEAQDCNAWMLVLLNFLREHGTAVTLVGDPDQCIYEFSMADATSLPILKEKWGIREMPLSRSFRCRIPIAESVRIIGGNQAFTGCGDALAINHGPFVIREGPSGSTTAVQTFLTMLNKAGIGLESAAIVCRGRGQLESIRGKAFYNKFQGKTKELATAAFLRDSRHDYRGAFQIVLGILRQLTGDDVLWQTMDESPNGGRGAAALLSIWRFVKDPQRLPPVSQLGGQWITLVRDGLAALINELGISSKGNLSHNIKRTGLADAQMKLPLFVGHENEPTVRQDTIHQVKGESIDAVLVVGSAQYWNSVVKAVVNGVNTEDRRLAYVAMTRARHLLVLAVPDSHFEQYSPTWEGWGFRVEE